MVGVATVDSVSYISGSCRRLMDGVDVVCTRTGEVDCGEWVSCWAKDAEVSSVLAGSHLSWTSSTVRGRNTTKILLISMAWFVSSTSTAAPTPPAWVRLPSVA